MEQKVFNNTVIDENIIDFFKNNIKTFNDEKTTVFTYNKNAEHFFKNIIVKVNDYIFKVFRETITRGSLDINYFFVYKNKINILNPIYSFNSFSQDHLAKRIEFKLNKESSVYLEFVYVFNKFNIKHLKYLYVKIDNQLFMCSDYETWENLKLFHNNSSFNDFCNFKNLEFDEFKLNTAFVKKYLRFFAKIGQIEKNEFYLKYPLRGLCMENIVVVDEDDEREEIMLSDISDQEDMNIIKEHFKNSNFNPFEQLKQENILFEDGYHIKYKDCDGVFYFRKHKNCIVFETNKEEIDKKQKIFEMLLK